MFQKNNFTCQSSFVRHLEASMNLKMKLPFNEIKKYKYSYKEIHFDSSSFKHFANSCLQIEERKYKIAVHSILLLGVDYCISNPQYRVGNFAKNLTENVHQYCEQIIHSMLPLCKLRSTYPVAVLIKRVTDDNIRLVILLYFT